jgi:hypothetical protein
VHIAFNEIAVMWPACWSKRLDISEQVVKIERVNVVTSENKV